MNKLPRLRAKLLLGKLTIYFKLFFRPRRSYARSGLPKAWFALAHKHKHKKNGQVRSSCACAYDYIVALTSKNGVDISTSINTWTWTNHRPLWPRPHANITEAIWRTKRPPSCCIVEMSCCQICHSARVCPYAHAYVLVKTRHKE